MRSGRSGLLHPYICRPSQTRLKVAQLLLQLCLPVGQHMFDKKYEKWRPQQKPCRAWLGFTMPGDATDGENHQLIGLEFVIKASCPHLPAAALISKVFAWHRLAGCTLHLLPVGESLALTSGSAGFAAPLSCEVGFILLLLVSVYKVPF